MGKKKEIWEVDCERYVALIDIMGFKDMVARKSHEQVSEILNDFHELKEFYSYDPKHGADSISYEERIRSLTFSDSILFVSQSNEIKDLRGIAHMLKYFNISSLSFGIPIKGGLSYGRFTADFSKSMFFGQPLIDAYQLQEELFYYGIIADHNVDKQIDLIKREREFKPYDHYFFRNLTPLKSGKVLHNNIRIDRVKMEELDKLYNTVSGRVRKYVDNTHEMYNLMLNSSYPTVFDLKREDE